MNIDLARRQMVEQQIRAWEVGDPRVLEVFSELPREAFVPPAFEGLAFADTAIPLPHGQFMLTPTVEGRILQALLPAADEDVLEIGTGSGFLTACLSRLAGSVSSVELFPDLAAGAQARLRQLGIANAKVQTLDAMRQLPAGLFDVVAVGGSLPVFDNRFFECLKPGGRLFVIVGTGPAMDARLVERDASGQPRVTSLFETRVAALENAPVPESFSF